MFSRKMRGVSLFFCVAVLLGVAMPASGQQTVAASAKATLADFAWLSGPWRGQTLGPNHFTVEQFWADAQGGVMMGMFRLFDPANNNRVLIMEFFTLRETPNGLEMRIRPFDTALAPMMEGDAILLKLVESDGTRFTFENPIHSHPKRSTMIRVGNDAFTARNEIVSATGDTNLIEVAVERTGNRPAANVAAPRAIEREVVVAAPLAEVWKAWTTVEGVKTFFAPDARIELRPGGAYEMYFGPTQPAGLRGSEGCKILAVRPMEFFSFNWNAPPSIPGARNSGQHTRVVLQFHEIAPGRTRVQMKHDDWPQNEDWDLAFAYFEKAWNSVLYQLQKRFTVGPRDWSAR